MPQQLVSPGTAATLLVGVLISVVYARYMWGALARAVRTLRRRPTDVGARLTLFWDDPNQSGHWPRLDDVATGGD